MCIRFKVSDFLRSGIQTGGTCDRRARFVGVDAYVAAGGTLERDLFDEELIESAIRKEATEILLTPVQESDMVRMDFGRLHCYYRQPKITPAQFAYLAIYLVLIGNVAAEEARTERLFRGSDERLYNLQFVKIRLPDSEPAVVIYIEHLRPTTTARWKK